MKKLLNFCLAASLLAALVFTACNKEENLNFDVAENASPENFVQPSGDPHRMCGVQENHERLLRENPFYEINRRNVEEFTRKFVEQNPKGVSDRSIVTIPVVVHVVWKAAAENVSDAQIMSQLAVLNADFRRLNADAGNTPAAFQPLAADAEVEFCLAQQKPDGSATSGIERRQTTVTSFSTNDAMKFFSQGGLDAWDASKYLNLWVCNLSGGILGYAQFPGGPANTDGVVCTFTAFGTTGSAQAPFNKGRTATHEVGHWLNLYHIWGDDGTSCSGSDQCADTPNQGDENYGCPAFPTVSCSNGPNGDMFMNYMDYTDDACMNMFSLGQKARMQALFAPGGSRVGLTTSNGCQPPSGGGTCGTPTNLNATSVTSTGATLNWGSVSGANSYNLQYKTAAATTWTSVNGLTGTSHALTGLTASTGYQFKVQSVCTSGTGSFSAVATFTTTGTGGGGGCTDNYESNNTRATAKVVPVNISTTAKIGTATDIDWFKFNNTTAQRRIKITLTNLPGDYDVYLYRGSTLVGASENPDTNDETIIWNTTTVGTYHVKVVGYGGAFSSTACYTLKAEISATNFTRQDGASDLRVTEKPKTLVGIKED